MARSESTRAPRGSWKRRARVWLGAPLDPALRERFERGQPAAPGATSPSARSSTTSGPRWRTSARELDALHRFLREAASTAAVNHPAVVRVLHVDVSGDGLLFQVQELVDGETLAALHAIEARSSRLPTTRLARKRAAE